MIALALTLGGFLGLFSGIGQIRLSSQSKSWPQTPGSIVFSQVDRRDNSSGNKTRISYWPNVQYRFAVNGKAYTGNQVQFGMKGFGTEADAQERVAKYGLGQPVNVHYDPESPSLNCLEAGTVVWTTYAWLVGGVLMILGGIYLGYEAINLAPRVQQLPRRYQ